MLSKSCEYAIRAVLYVGSRQKTNPEARIGIKEIAAALEIPTHFLGKILQNLSRHDILSSIKGPNGGFFITDAQLLQPMIRIVELVDGLQIFRRCGLGLKMCSDAHPCPVHNDFKPCREGMENALRNRTIASMVENLSAGNVHLVS